MSCWSTLSTQTVMWKMSWNGHMHRKQDQVCPMVGRLHRAVPALLYTPLQDLQVSPQPITGIPEELITTLVLYGHRRKRWWLRHLGSETVMNFRTSHSASARSPTALTSEQLRLQSKLPGSYAGSAATSWLMLGSGSVSSPGAQAVDWEAWILYPGGSQDLGSLPLLAVSVLSPVSQRRLL